MTEPLGKLLSSLLYLPVVGPVHTGNVYILFSILNVHSLHTSDDLSHLVVRSRDRAVPLRRLPGHTRVVMITKLEQSTCQSDFRRMHSSGAR